MVWKGKGGKWRGGEGYGCEYERGDRQEEGRGVQGGEGKGGGVGFGVGRI